jgi:hypothetical protein
VNIRFRYHASPFESRAFSKPFSCFDEQIPVAGGDPGNPDTANAQIRRVQAVPEVTILFILSASAEKGRIVLLMQAKIPANGHVVLPIPVRHSLGAGDPLDIHAVHGTIVSGG